MDGSLRWRCYKHIFSDTAAVFAIVQLRSIVDYWPFVFRVNGHSLFLSKMC